MKCLLFICVMFFGFRQFGVKSTTTELPTGFTKLVQIQQSAGHCAIQEADQPSFINQRIVTRARPAKNNYWPESIAGNEPPKVDIDILQGNKTFYFPDRSIQYTVRVVDAEDGSLDDGRISPDLVTVRMDYISKRFDSTTALLEARVPEELPAFAIAQKLIIESDCRACHSINKLGVGPTYERIAQKYRGDPDAVDRLARKVIAGGKGVWGEATMSPHPQLAFNDASTIVAYILSLSETRSTGTKLPISGTYTPVTTESESGDGYYRLSGSYTDRGTQSSGPIKTEQVKFFRNPVLLPEQATWRRLIRPASGQTGAYHAIGLSSYLGYSQLDMTGISQLVVKAKAPANETVPRGSIEVRLDSLTGKLIGGTAIDKTSLLVLGDSGANAKMSVRIDLVPSLGAHNVYFLFKNSQASPRQVLMQIESLILHP